MSKPYVNISVSAVLLDSDGQPIIQTGQESKIQIEDSVIAGFKNEEDRKEMFLALCHRGAERLWQAMRDNLMVPSS